MRVTRLQRLKIKITEIIVFSCIFSSLSCIAFAQPIASDQLIEKAAQYDNQTVTFQGEVIGDVMIRGDFAWVNINDGTNALGIWVPKNLTKEIMYEGSYKAKGDLLEAEGQFHRACLEHGGDMDIHARRLDKLQPGHAVPEKLDKNKRNTALALTGVLCLILILQALKKK